MITSCQGGRAVLAQTRVLAWGGSWPRGAIGQKIFICISNVNSLRHDVHGHLVPAGADHVRYQIASLIKHTLPGCHWRGMPWENATLVSAGEDALCAKRPGALSPYKIKQDFPDSRFVECTMTPRNDDTKAVPTYSRDRPKTVRGL